MSLLPIVKVRLVVCQVWLKTGPEAVEVIEAVAHLKYVVELAHGALKARLVRLWLQ